MRLDQRLTFRLAIAALLALPACGSDNSDNDKLLTDAEYEQNAILDVKSFIQTNLDNLAAASAALQAAAPAPDADGWSATSDPAAMTEMKAQWKKAREAYEHVEGAIAVVFPELDVSTDARYDAFIETKADEDLFDGEGVTGVHAIERILWADAIPVSVVAFESQLAGYKAAAFPATEAEAEAFKNKLCARLVEDTKKMQSDFRGRALAAPSAYRGVIGSIREQVEKVEKAATGEEESRYAQYTLADMRANIAAGRTTYLAFQEWLLTKGGDAGKTDQRILEGFTRIEDALKENTSDALPAVPEAWSSDMPTAEQLNTPFGQLFSIIRNESNGESEGSLAYDMNLSADTLGIDPL